MRKTSDLDVFRVAERAAHHMFRIELEQVLQFLHQPRHAAGIVEMLHVVVTGRLEIDQHRRFLADLVIFFQRQRRVRATRDSGEINVDSWPILTKEQVATELVARIASTMEKAS